MKMTVDDFIANIEGYYRDKYNDVQLKFIKNWLSCRSPEYLPFIFSEVLKSVSPKYKACPGISELEDALKVEKKERINEVFPTALPEPLPEKDPEQIRRMEAMLKKLSEKLRFKNE